MYKATIKYQLLALAALFVFVSCGDDQGLNVIDPGLTDNNADLVVVDGGENVSLEIKKGTNSYFDLIVKNNGSNSHLTTGSKNGWTLGWESTVAEETTYTGVTLYSTYNQNGWKSVNYLLNHKEEIKANHPDAGYLDFQAALWVLLEFTEFDIETVDPSVLPEDMQRDGQPAYDAMNVQAIVDMAISGGNSYSYSPSSTYAVVAATADEGEVAIIENTYFAFELIDLREAYGMVVAWDVNDQGQLAGGNLFVESDGTSVSMGNIFARALNNNGQVVGNSGRQAAYWDASNGLIELTASNESDQSQANDINDNGDIAGEVIVEHLLYEDEDYGDVYEQEYHSFLWSDTSGDQAISGNGWAAGINNFGDVTGLDYSVNERAYIWNSQSGLNSLGSFYGFTSARGHAVNNNKQVVGSVLVSKEESAATIASDNLRALDMEIKRANLDGVYARAHIMEMMRTSTLDREVRMLDASMNVNINELNRTFSSRMKSSSSSQSEAFIWDESQGMMNLGTLGGDWSTAWDVNDAGQVIGYSSIGDGESRAFIWVDGHGMIELPTFGGNSLARSINNEGQIVGYSYDDSGNFYPVMWRVSTR